MAIVRINIDDTLAQWLDQAAADNQMTTEACIADLLLKTMRANVPIGAGSDRAAVPIAVRVLQRRVDALEVSVAELRNAYATIRRRFPGEVAL